MPHSKKTTVLTKNDIVKHKKKTIADNEHSENYTRLSDKL
jgi:hypothetical protein